MSKLLPFRQYSEQDVINIFAVDSNNMEAGTLVSMQTGNSTNQPFELIDTDYLGASFPDAHVGGNKYPVVQNRVTVAEDTDWAQGILGITLLDIREYDENGNKLLYNPTKKEELQAILSGEAMPIATRGIFTLTKDAYIGNPDAADKRFGIASGNGRVLALSESDLSTAGYTMMNVVGTFLTSPNTNDSQSGVLFKLGR